MNRLCCNTFKINLWRHFINFGHKGYREAWTYAQYCALLLTTRLPQNWQEPQLIWTMNTSFWRCSQWKRSLSIHLPPTAHVSFSFIKSTRGFAVVVKDLESISLIVFLTEGINLIDNGENCFRWMHLLQSRGWYYKSNFTVNSKAKRFDKRIAITLVMFK